MKGGELCQPRKRPPGRKQLPKKNNQKTEKDLLLCSLRDRDHYKQRGDGGEQADVLWPADEAENCPEMSLLIFRMGLESFISPARIHTQFSSSIKKDVIQIIDKFVRLLLNFVKKLKN